MDQTFYFNTSMTHSFLRYAENTHIMNEKVQVLIDDLRKGLREEDQLQGQTPTNKLNSQKQKNVMLCYCIMLHVQCLADICDNHELYDQFIDDWHLLSAS